MINSDDYGFHSMLFFAIIFIVFTHFFAVSSCVFSSALEIRFIVMRMWTVLMMRITVHDSNDIPKP